MASGTIESNREGTWATIPDQPTPSIYYANYIVRNGVCYVMLYDSQTYSFTAAQWVAMGTLPTWARPSRRIYASFADRYGYSGEVQITEDGIVHINSNRTGKVFISCIIAFPL